MVLGNKKKYFGTQKFRIFYIKNHPPQSIMGIQKQKCR